MHITIDHITAYIPAYFPPNRFFSGTNNYTDIWAAYNCEAIGRVQRPTILITIASRHLFFSFFFNFNLNSRREPEPLWLIEYFRVARQITSPIR